MKLLDAAAIEEFAAQELRDLASVRPNAASAATLAMLYRNVGLRAMGVNWLQSPGCPPTVRGFGFGVRWVEGQPTDEPLVRVYGSSTDGSPLASRSVTVPREFAQLLTLEVVRDSIEGRVDLTEIDLVCPLTTGVPQASPASVDALRARQRPIHAGCSIGHPDVAAGTLGIPVVENRRSGASRALILSTCHALAGDPMRPKRGDPTLQPGRVDLGDPTSDVIGRLVDFEPLRDNRLPNYMDAAIAELDDPSMLGDGLQGLGLGSVRYWRALGDIPIGLRVAKLGRTTGLTFGVVTALGVAMKISYGGAEPLLFVNQIMTSHVAGGGDSGAVLIALDERPSVIGLVFGGSRDVTLATPIEVIHKRFDVLAAPERWHPQPS